VINERLFISLDEINKIPFFFNLHAGAATTQRKIKMLV